MRLFELTNRGRAEVKVTRRNRNVVLDYINGNPTKTATLDELVTVVGPEAHTRVRELIRDGLVREVE